MNNVRKIVVIGGESTGKSTLSAQLAAAYETSWVKEYARAYLEKCKGHYVYEDLKQIAKGQIESEDLQLAKAKKFLFCDTDLQVIQVWSEYKFRRCDPWIVHEIEHRKYHGYILTAPDFPWVSDPLREHPEAHLRDYFFECYKRMLLRSQIPFCIADGNQEKRLLQAMHFIDKL
ncbi:MAG: ATP-binding protein [Bacteroidetes bacterium]|nr:ATP-binding protein [Bacteroidota bacterium]MBK8144988.1 ATP-binding protein [Bacteroidota bacterium]MBP6314968.1 ATP-binding protein [Chitinophagaceae bacterium]